ncbi:MAG: peptidoglycan-binding protein [Nitrososphaera sp.]|nr:peptidoglycan-binding protein [Nitrososphaera sp.]
MKNALRRLGLFVAFLPLPIAAEAPSEDLVREAQFLLMAKGLNAGPIDGKLGRKTKEAIRLYEGQRNFPIIGLPTYDLIAKLREETATTRGSPDREPKNGATANSDITERVDSLSQEIKNIREHVVAAERVIRKVDSDVGGQLINGFRDLAVLSFAIFGIIVAIFVAVAPFAARRMSRTIRDQVETTHDSMTALSIAKINATVYANIGGHCLYLYKDLPENREKLYESYLTLAVHISGLGYRYAKDLQKTAIEEKRPAVRRHLFKVLSWLGRTTEEPALLKKIENLVYGCINNYVYYLSARANSEDKKLLLNILEELKTISIEQEKVKNDNPSWYDYKETVAWAEFRLGRIIANDLQKLVQALIDDKDIPTAWKSLTVARYNCHNRFRLVPPSMDEIKVALPDSVRPTEEE